MSEVRENICIYGASSSHIDEIYLKDARRVGELIASKGYGLISGGGRGGLMAAAIEGSISCGGKTIGVLPRFMIEREWQHPSLSEVIVTESMHLRKQTMASISKAVIAMPGGIGTLEEMAEIITWRQLKLFFGNVVILNTDGYYNPLLDMFAKMNQKGFMREGSGRLWQVAVSPEEAVEMAIE